MRRSLRELLGRVEALESVLYAQSEEGERYLPPIAQNQYQLAEDILGIQSSLAQVILPQAERALEDARALNSATQELLGSNRELLDVLDEEVKALRQQGDRLVKDLESVNGALALLPSRWRDELVKSIRSGLS